jgi:hypothetical protein
LGVSGVYVCIRREPTSTYPIALDR